MTPKRQVQVQARKQAAQAARFRRIAAWVLWGALGTMVVALMFLVRPGGPASHLVPGSQPILRVAGGGRSDASHVLHPAAVTAPQRARDAYAIAARIPATLNQLFCWCGCHGGAGHRSNLACFEDAHGASCDVCIVTAEMAWAMVQKGVTDPARIQVAVDARYRRL